MFVARIEVVRLKRTIFHKHIGGAIKSGASKVNYFPRECLWLFTASSGQLSLAPEIKERVNHKCRYPF
jgi:hypothetical protein